jgi:hypothetical protein
MPPGSIGPRGQMGASEIDVNRAVCAPQWQQGAAVGTTAINVFVRAKMPEACRRPDI